MIRAQDAKALADSFSVDQQTKDDALVIINVAVTDAANSGKKEVIISDGIIKAAMFEKSLATELKDLGYIVIPGRAQYKISWDKIR